MFTINDLLDIKAIEGVKLVAGKTGINNQVSIVNVIENPDVFDWLTPNELILSTGYIFKDSEVLQNRVIRELAENNCAGLVVKMKRYLDRLPQNMIDLANELGLPLLELPFEYTLSRVIAIINEKTKADYDALNRRSLDMNNALVKIVLEGGGMEQISYELCEMIQNPVLILDQEWNLLCYKEPRESDIPLRQLFSLVKNKPVLPVEFTEQIPKYISEIKKSIKRTYIHQEREYKCRIMPIAVSSYVYGYIVVFQTIRKLREFDYLALEHASTILAMDRIKAKEIEEVRLKIRQDFFDDLLSGNMASMENMKTLSDLHGLQAKYAYYCVLIQMEPEYLESYEDIVVRKYELEHIAKKCVQLIQAMPGKGRGEVTCYYRNQQIVILVGRHEHKPSVTELEAKAYAQEVYELLVSQVKGSTLYIGIGGQYKTVYLLHKSFYEAQAVIRLMLRFKGPRMISHFEDYAGYHFLESNIKPAEMEQFFYKVLGAVHEHDQSFGTEFLSTLDAYFMHNQNVTEASKELFIHRNTFIYRMDKIKQLLHSDLKDADGLFRIQLALKLYRLLSDDSVVS